MVCACPSAPVNYWLMASGDWIAASDLGARGVAGAFRLGLADAKLYTALGAVAWRIACPECGAVYADGGD